LEHEKEFCYTEIDRLEQEVAHRQAMLSTQVESLGQAQEQRHHLEQRLAQITQQKREATDEVAQLQAQQRDATAALQRHEAASRAANEARAKREESDRRANDERAAHLARVTAASDAAVARLERDVAEARRAANERRGQCETLTAQLSELKRTHNDAEHEVRQLQQRVEELQATALESRAAADDAEALNEALRADMDALRNRTAAAERRAHRAESACDQLRDRLAAISTASSLDSSNSAGAATTPGRVAALRERLRDTETDRDALRQRCELAEQRIAELESHRSLKAESAMQAKLLAAQQRCEALQIRNDTLTRERDELQRQLTNSAAAVAATAAPAARARQRVAAAVAAAANTSFSPQPQPRSAPTAYVHQKSRTDDNDADDHHLGTNGTSTPDEIEQHVQAMLREHAAHDIGSQLPANFHRIAPGVYQFGTRKVYLQLRNGALMARVGGGFVKLLDFIDRHGPQERIRLRRLASQFGDALSSTVAAPTPAPAPATATPSSTTAYYSGTSPTLAAVHSSYAAARAAKSPPTQTPLMAAESVSNMHSKPSPKWSRM
jgi:myosin heavy subunit